MIAVFCIHCSNLVGQQSNKTHLGGCVLKKPIGHVPNDLYAKSAIVRTGDYAPFTKKLTVCGITLIATDDVPDSFVTLVGDTVAEMFRKSEQTDIGKQKEVIQNLYRYHAVLPIFPGEDFSIIEKNEDAWLAVEAKASVCDVVMANVEGQVVEVVEHILHTVTDVGLHYTFPKQWGISGTSKLKVAMKQAIKGGHYDIEQYSMFKREDEEAYNRVILQELAYWFINTKWGIHATFGPKGAEWSIETSAELKKLFSDFDDVCDATVGKVMSPPTEPMLKKIHALEAQAGQRKNQILDQSESAAEAMSIIEEFDENEDGQLQRAEVPNEHHANFDAADGNKDEVVTLKELLSAMEDGDEKETL